MARVVGYASSALFDRDDPLNPVNRRIDIVVLTKKAQRAIEGEQDGAADAESEGAGSTAAPDAPQPPDTEPAGPDEVRERLNIFEDGVLQLDQPSE
ncbi:flagellar motor protein MotB [compost metagenome]